MLNSFRKVEALLKFDAFIFLYKWPINQTLTLFHNRADPPALRVQTIVLTPVVYEDLKAALECFPMLIHRLNASTRMC